MDNYKFTATSVLTPRKLWSARFLDFVLPRYPIWIVGFFLGLVLTQLLK
jgi:uncharacterized membrane protein